MFTCQTDKFLYVLILHVNTLELLFTYKSKLLTKLKSCDVITRWQVIAFAMFIFGRSIIGDHCVWRFFTSQSRCCLALYQFEDPICLLFL